MNMYRDNIAVALKVNGKVLRENNGTVNLPFGTEYSILVKNLNPVRIQFRVDIDGNQATEGTWVIVSPNDSVELERSIKNGNMHVGNKFKFVERTAAIEQHRGIKIDDGLVRVECKKELVIPKQVYDPYIFDRRKSPWDNPRPWGRHPWDRRRRSAGLYKSEAPIASSSPVRGLSSHFIGAVTQTDTSNYSNASYSECFTNSSVPSAPGITVPGGESHQQFVSGEWFATEATSTVIILQLKGQVGKVKVSKPLTVQSKPKCQSCGLQNKSANAFCSRCGTSLHVYA